MKQLLFAALAAVLLATVRVQAQNCAPGDGACECIQSKPAVLKAFGTICKEQVETVNGVVYNPYEGILYGKDEIKLFDYTGDISDVPVETQVLYQGECGDHTIFVNYPVTKGHYYTVTLFMAEVYEARQDGLNPNDRMFNIYIEGQQVADRLKIIQQTGGKLFSGFNITWTGFVEDDVLNIYLHEITREAKFGAILVQQLDCTSPPPKPAPPCTGNPPNKACPPGVTDPSSPACKPYTWGTYCRQRFPNYLRPGTETPKEITIDGQTFSAIWNTNYAVSPAPADIVSQFDYREDIANAGAWTYLYQGECLGSEIHLAFDVPNGLYKVTLLTAETYFQTDIAQNRAFWIMVQGLNVTSNGPYSNTAFVTAEPVIINDVPVTTGKLIIDLLPFINQPRIAGVFLELLSCGNDQGSPPLPPPEASPPAGQSPPLCPPVNSPCMDIKPYPDRSDILRCSCGKFEEVLDGPDACSQCIASECRLPQPGTAIGTATYYLYAGQYNIVGTVHVWMEPNNPSNVFVTIKADTENRNAFLSLASDIKIYLGTDKGAAIAGKGAANYRLQAEQCGLKVACVSFIATLPDGTAPSTKLYLFIHTNAGTFCTDCQVILVPDQDACLNALNPSDASSGVMCKAPVTDTKYLCGAAAPSWCGIYTYAVPDVSQDASHPDCYSSCAVPCPKKQKPGTSVI